LKIEDLLRRICTALDMNHVPYMVTGSLASSVHGEPRSTNDLDVVIAPTRDQLFSLIQLFKRVGFYVRWEEAEAAFKKRDMFNVSDVENGWKVDLIVRKARDFSVAEFERREPVEIDGFELVITSAEDILLAKLEWFKIGESERQLDDVAGIIRAQRDKLDTAYVEKWVEALGLNSEWLKARARAGVS
jgi:predicted nucleotidyltransferase